MSKVLDFSKNSKGRATQVFDCPRTTPSLYGICMESKLKLVVTLYERIVLKVSDFD